MKINQKVILHDEKGRDKKGIIKVIHSDTILTITVPHATGTQNYRRIKKKNNLTPKKAISWSEIKDKKDSKKDDKPKK